MNGHWPSTNLVADRVGYFYVQDNSDWRFVLTDIKDESGESLDLSNSELKVQFRSINLSGLSVASLSSTNGITVSGSTISIVSLASQRSWSARDTVELYGDLMIYRGSGNQRSSTRIMRLCLIVEPGTTSYV